MKDLRVDVAPLDQELHQIDAWEGHIYVTDTANNCVLVYRVKTDGLSFERAHYPCGPLSDGKKSNNYAHINSIFQSNERIYLMYHNQTKYTGRTSQIAVLNKGWDVLEVLDTPADSAHNVFCDEGGLVYCDSRNGRLMRNDEVLLGQNVYLRGLAVSESWWLLGGSEFANRSERGTTTGSVYQWSLAKREAVAQLSIPDAGSVYEIRLVDKKDRSLSS